MLYGLELITRVSLSQKLLFSYARILLIFSQTIRLIKVLGSVLFVKGGYWLLSLAMFTHVDGVVTSSIVLDFLG